MAFLPAAVHSFAVYHWRVKKSFRSGSARQLRAPSQAIAVKSERKHTWSIAAWREFYVIQVRLGSLYGRLGPEGSGLVLLKLLFGAEVGLVRGDEDAGGDDGCGGAK